MQTARHYHLRPNQVLAFQGVAGQRLTVQAGMLWVSEAGHDTVLKAGDSVRLQGGDKVVLEAVLHTTFSHVPAASWWGRLVSRLKTSLRKPLARLFLRATWEVA